MKIQQQVRNYNDALMNHLRIVDDKAIEKLGEALLQCFKSKKQVFVCGNGGSGSNANHIANDLIYGISKQKGRGIRCHSLSSNTSTLLCLANDEGYENIFSFQLAALADAGDVLIVLSGSGNSKNIINVLQTAKEMKVQSFAILGYDGGKAKSLSETVIHSY